MLLFYSGLSLVLPYLIWSTTQFINNYRAARKIGLPILISPVSPNSPIWMLTKDRLIPIISSLPYGLGDWATRAEIGWTYYSKFSIHSKHGEAFTIVTPGSNEIFIAEPTATDDIMRRRNDFIKDPAIYGMLDVYGPNLDTVNGKVWDRHRKITVPPFNEQNSALVWRATAKQAEHMLEAWHQQAVVTSTQYDVHAVALDVLCGAGFGLHSSYIDSKPAGTDGQSKTRLGYRESLRTLLANIVQLVLLTLLTKAGVPKWTFWGGMRKVLQAYEEFKGYMGEMLHNEKVAFEQGDLTRHNLMSALVRASEQAQKTVPSNDASKDSSLAVTAGLSDEEVYGNLFIYNLAGHDTTAATVHFAITMLTIFPEWQSWVAEEIDQVRKADTSSMWFYEQTFPLLKRCLALMYETVRLYGPVVMMPRYTGDAAQKLVIKDKEYVLPPKTSITINFAALHTHPDYWGHDALAFKPDRWIVSDEKKTAETGLFQPVPGSFVPWNAGPRVCPGKKFSQVEFVRLMFTLFGNGSRVELVREPEEDEQAAKAQVLKIVNEAKVEVTLKMVQAERIKVRWIKQGKTS